MVIIKQSIKTIFTGLLILLTVLVNLLQNGCKNEPLVNDINYDNKSIFRAFYNTSVHMEIEKKDLPTQFFFDVPLNSIHNKILVLNKHINLEGEIVGFDDYLKKDFKDDKHQNNLFSTMLAIPLLNDSLFNLAKIYSQKTALGSEKKFNFSLLKNFPYFVVLNPYGKHKKAPIYFHIKNLEKDTNYKFNNAGYEKNFSGKIIGLPLEDVNPDLTKIAIYQGPYLISSVSNIDNTGNFNLELSKKLELQNIPTYIIININKDQYNYTVKHEINENIYNSKYKIIKINNNTSFDLNINLETQTKENIQNGLIILKNKKDLTELIISLKINNQSSIIIPNLSQDKYDIGIFPSLDSIFSSTILENQEITNQNFTAFIKKRTKLDASIFTKENLPLKNAQIEIFKNNPNFDINDNIFGENLFKISGFTNEEGNVCSFNNYNDSNCLPILLDDGLYTIFIKPNQGSYLGYSYYDFNFPSDNLFINLDKAFNFKTKITLSDGNPLTDAFVTFYTIKNNQKRILAVSITDQQGEIKAPISFMR